jgi:hypothetical protein
MYRLTLWLALTGACTTPPSEVTCTASLTSTSSAYRITANLACDRAAGVHVDLGLDDDSGTLGSVLVVTRCPGSVAANIAARPADGRVYATVGVYNTDGADVCWGYLP